MKAHHAKGPSPESGQAFMEGFPESAEGDGPERAFVMGFCSENQAARRHPHGRLKRVLWGITILCVLVVLAVLAPGNVRITTEPSVAQATSKTPVSGPGHAVRQSSAPPSCTAEPLTVEELGELLPFAAGLAASAIEFLSPRSARDGLVLAQADDPAPIIETVPIITNEMPIITRTQPQAAATGPAVTPPQIIRKPRDGHVTNVFYDSDLSEVFLDLSDQTGVSIVAGPDVQGFVTVSLEDVPLDDALARVLSGTGYIVKKMPDYYLVSSAKPGTPLFLDVSETHLVKLNYADAASVTHLLPTDLQQYVETDAANNYVSVTAPPKILARVTQILENLDRRPRQIVLDAVIVVMEGGKSLDAGVKWGWPVVGVGAYSDSGLHGQDHEDTFSKWPWGIRIGYTPDKSFTESLVVTLNMMMQNDQATVVASPQVMVLEGKEAQINATTEEYFKILSEGVYTRTELEKIEVGTKLNIKPRIGADGIITLEMAIEVSDVVARGSDNLPVVTRRIAKTHVQVMDGGTAVIAGLVNNSTRITKNRVPGLGALPGLGRVFRSKNKNEVSKQTYIFVTPRLVEGDRPAGASTDAPWDPQDVVETVGGEFQNELEQSLKRLGRDKS